MLGWASTQGAGGSGAGEGAHMGDTTTHATTHHPTHGQHSSHQLVQLLPLVLLSSWATPACWWRAWQGELAQGKTTQHAQPHPPPSTPNHCPQATCKLVQDTNPRWRPGSTKAYNILGSSHFLAGPSPKPYYVSVTQGCLAPAIKPEP